MICARNIGDNTISLKKKVSKSKIKILKKKKNTIS